MTHTRADKNTIIFIQFTHQQAAKPRLCASLAAYYNENLYSHLDLHSVDTDYSHYDVVTTTTTMAKSKTLVKHVNYIWRGRASAIWLFENMLDHLYNSLFFHFEITSNALNNNNNIRKHRNDFWWFNRFCWLESTADLLRKYKNHCQKKVNTLNCICTWIMC